MRKLLLILSALVLTIGLSQCTKQKPDVPHYSGPMGDIYVQHVVIDASHGNNNSKIGGTQEDGELELFWNSGDKIYVINQTHPELEIKPLELNGDGGGTSGEFEGDIEGVEGDTLTFYYVGTKTALKEDDKKNGAVVYDESNFMEQDGSLETILDHLLFMIKDVNFPLDNNTVNLYIPYSIHKLDLSALGTEAKEGNEVRIKVEGNIVSTVKNVTSESKVMYVGIPTNNVSNTEEPTEVTYVFEGNGKYVEKTWKIKQDVFYTSNSPEAGSPIVIKPQPTISIADFAPGNLYWENNAFYFEENQWDFEDKWTPNFNGKFSHFYWTSDADLSHLKDYTETPSSTHIIFTDHTDFQVNGYKIGEWRTPTSEEWNYLLVERTNASNLRMWKNLKGENKGNNKHYGLVILPDDADATVMNNINNVSDLKEYGALFLPAAGYRQEGGAGINQTNKEGNYWSNNSNGDKEAYRLYFDEQNIYPQRSYGKNFGCAIRLVRANKQ